MSITLNGTEGITLDNGSADGAQVTLASSGYSNWNLDNYSGRFRAYYNATEYFTITNAGNVGIGTSSPGASTRLNVSGRGLFTSGSYDSFDSTASGVSISYDTVNNVGIIGAIQTGVAEREMRFRGNTLTFYTNGANERMRIDVSGNLLFNSGYGSAATAYGCRAWVNFNGTGTVAIRGSGNVSSITDLGTGNYQVNFTTAMPDTNYATNYNLAESYGSGNYSYIGTVNNTTGYVQMYGRTGGTGAAADMANCMVSIHR